MKTLLKNAKILSMKDDHIATGDVVIEDERIIYVGLDSAKYGPFDIVRDIKGNLLMPTFKNAHTHSAMTFLRSKTDDFNLQDWLFKVVFPREEHLTEDYVYKFAKVAYLECLTSGVSVCFDQYFFPLASKKAAEEIGMRIVLLGVYNSLYGKEDLKKFYHDINKENGLARYHFGIHAEYTCPDSELEIMNEIIHEEKAPFFTHISETEKEVKECYEKRGMSPVKFLASKGLYDFGGGGYHCCHFNDEDIEIFKKYHLSVVTCPGSNTKLASGIAPICKYLENGINVAIGTDGPASNNSLDMFKEMTLLYALQKVTLKDPTALPAFEILKMATVNGAKAMGLKDMDYLEAGQYADIMEIDLHRPNMQPINNIVNNIVYSGSKENIKMTMINGRILYADGEFHLKESIDKIYEECQQATLEIESLYEKAQQSK